MQNIEELMAEFSTRELTTAAKQIKATENYLTDTFFAKRTAVDSPNAVLSIKRGAPKILGSIAADAAAQDFTHYEEFKISAQIPRYALSNNLSAYLLNSLAAYDSLNTKRESLADAIGDIISAHKAHYEQTIEYMAAGALAGKVIDGNGAELFELENKSETVTLGAKNLLDWREEIATNLRRELGSLGGNLTVLATPELLAEIYKKAQTEKLFQAGAASQQIIDGRITLLLHGLKVIEYQGEYKNAKGDVINLLESGSGLVVPKADIFKFIYTRANHIDALNSTPELIFVAKPERIDGGRGYAINSECRPLLYCERPQAIVKLNIN